MNAKKYQGLFESALRSARAAAGHSFRVSTYMVSPDCCLATIILWRWFPLLLSRFLRDRSLPFSSIVTAVFFSQVNSSLLTISMAGGRRQHRPADILQYPTSDCKSQNGGNTQANVRWRGQLTTQLLRPPCSHCWHLILSRILTARI